MVKYLSINDLEKVRLRFFPALWLKELKDELNSDPRYAKIAKNWEGYLFFYIEPEDHLWERLAFYLDLWHGRCRKVEYNPQADSHPNPAFTLIASYNNITAILSRKLNLVTATLTSKLKTQGSTGFMMWNVPPCSILCV